MINTLPEALPVALGVKVVVNVVLSPAAKVNGSDGPLISKPFPEAAAWIIMMAALLEFVTVTLWLLLEPIGTFPKLRFPGLTPRFAGATHPDWIRAINNTVSATRSLLPRAGTS